MGQEGRVPPDSFEEIGRSDGMMDSGYQNSGSIPHLAVQTLLGNLNLSVLATSSGKPRETTWLTGQWAEVKEVLALRQYLAQGVNTECGSRLPSGCKCQLVQPLRGPTCHWPSPWERWHVTCTNKNSTFPRRPMTTFLETKKSGWK